MRELIGALNEMMAVHLAWKLKDMFYNLGPQYQHVAHKNNNNS